MTQQFKTRMKTINDQRYIKRRTLLRAIDLPEPKDGDKLITILAIGVPLSLAVGYLVALVVLLILGV